MKRNFTKYKKSDICANGLYLFPLVCFMSLFTFEIYYLNLERTANQNEDGILSRHILEKNKIQHTDKASEIISSFQDYNHISSETLVRDFISNEGAVKSKPKSQDINNFEPIKSFKKDFVNKISYFSAVSRDVTSASRAITNRINPSYSRSPGRATDPKNLQFSIIERLKQLNNSLKNQSMQRLLTADINQEHKAITLTPDSPGEFGKPVIVDPRKLPAEDQLRYYQGWKNFVFNEYVSRMISLNRQLQDPRDKACLHMQYSENLPDASVVMTFHNEAWSVLLRSVHSIINRSPRHLLKEIILVDDFSTMEHLKSPLVDYMTQFKKVKIVRAKRREGLIRARLLGFAVATGSAIVFLDSHIECTVGWLEPLLDRIALNRTTVAAPAIDIINDDTFAHFFQSARTTNIGGFDWSLTFKWQTVSKEERSRRQFQDHLPIRSPTMAGGLFAISRDFFEYLGTYDEGMEFWGGENLELSFRIWMCGGTLETVPCSHVGHIFRKRSPYKWHDEQNVVKSNNLRLAEVWMDDFKFYYYQSIRYKILDFGDVSSRKTIRERLQCKDFNWYLTHIYPDVHVPAEALYSGEIRSKVHKLCLDGPYLYGKVDKPLQVVYCHGLEGPQYWLYTRKLEIRHDYGCFDYDGRILQVAACHSQGGNQKWMYKNNMLLYHIPTSLCMELSADGKSVFMNKCTETDSQIWLWNNQSPVGPVRIWL